MKKFRSIIIFVVAPILIGLYFIGGFYYKDRFPSKVYINQVNVGGKKLKKADSKLAKSDLWNKITIKSDAEDFLEIEADQIDYKYIRTPELDEIFKKEKEENWLLSKFHESKYETDIESAYNKDTIKNNIDTIEQLDKKLLDASIIYSTISNSFVIEPHSYEINLSREELFDLVVEAIERRHSEVNIEKYIEYPNIFEDDPLLIQARDQANKYLDLKIKYDFGNREELIDGPILKDFISFHDRKAAIDPEKVKDYVAELARKYDTFGRNRNFKTSQGRSITTDGGSYGWLIHRGKTVENLIEAIENGENKTMEPVYSYEALIRDSDDIGDSYVEIDLKEQMVYVYIKGELKVKSQTVTGNLAKGNDTPTGVYPVNYKEREAILKGEDYESPVDYWIPFNKNIGLHDADWRHSFGGDIYEKNGSNGCINLPPSKAKTIFDLVYPGMPVIVH